MQRTIRPAADSRSRRASLLAALVTAGLLSVTACGPGGQQAADLVLRGGKIVTVDSTRPAAGALAVSGDTIVAVGSDAEIEPYVGADTRVIELAGDTDYRLQLLQQAGTYMTPHDESARARLRELFRESASSKVEHDRKLEINGRALKTRRCAKGIAWFDFSELCDGPRSQADYIEIARWYPTIILSGVPQLDEFSENQARRFIALVDEFYDRHVKLIVSADLPPDGLYTGKRLRFEFERTVSRLIEMQSTEYLHLPHLA